jgi:hypothetical protein
MYDGDVEKKGTKRISVDPKLRQRRDLKNIFYRRKDLQGRRNGCVIGFFKHTCQS